MNGFKEKKYNIEELSELTGFSRRTIRFYIQENILEGPSGRGRGGFYFESHLEALLKIKELQEKGLNLDFIKKSIKEESVEKISNSEDKTVRQVWANYEISEGIILSIRRDVEEKNIKKIKNILNFLILNTKEIDSD